MKHCAVFLLPIWLMSMTPYASVVPRSGVIYIDGKQRFTMTNVEKQDGQFIEKTTEYLDNASKIVGRDVTRYNASTLEVHEGTMTNLATGSVEKIVRLGANRYRLEYKNNGSAAVESEEVSDKGTMLKGALLFEYIARNYSAIAGGAVAEFRLLAPSRLETVGFELITKGEETVQGKSCLLLKLQASSWIIRQFAGDIHFWVDVKPPHTVVQYRGRLTPTDEKGNALSGTVVYK